MTTSASGCESVSVCSCKVCGTPLSLRMKSLAVREKTVSPDLVFTNAGTSTTVELVRIRFCDGGASLVCCLLVASLEGALLWLCASTDGPAASRSNNAPEQTYRGNRSMADFM